VDGYVRITEAARRLGVSAQYLPVLEWVGIIPPARWDFDGRLYSGIDIAHTTRRHKLYQKGAIMVAILRTKAKEKFGPDPSLDLPQGAHLKVEGARHFLPKFQEEAGDLGTPKISLKLREARREPRGEAEG
jgi:hypothetical protein